MNFIELIHVRKRKEIQNAALQHQSTPANPGGKRRNMHPRIIAS
jgi:hypothetical protein